MTGIIPTPIIASLDQSHSAHADFLGNERCQLLAHKSIRAITAALLAVALAPSAFAQPKPPTTYDRAIAAGYKALTLCGAIFNAGRTQAQAEALELTGIYPDYDAIVPTLTATVDDARQKAQGIDTAVSVPFDKSLPPRIAIFETGKGCTIRPVGDESLVVRSVERSTPKAPVAPPYDDGFWPILGERNALRLLPKAQSILPGAFTEKFGARTRTTGVVVVRDSKIIAERYADGFGPHTSQRTWSVAKSLNATIIGMLANRGAIDPAKPAAIPEWQTPGDPRQAITIDHLLRMASGLHSATAGNRTDAIYFGGTTVTDEATAWPLEARPGTRFRYANNDTLLAARAVRAALDDSAETNAQIVKEVFDSIGMTRTVAETDWQGNFILSSQVWSTARDLARFGLFYLDDGISADERLLPRGWIDYITRPSGPQPEGAFGYGAGFWLMSRSPGVPTDTYFAQGNRGQYVVIVPSKKTVIVRRGEDPAGAPFDIAKFTAEVLAAIQ